MTMVLCHKSAVVDGKTQIQNDGKTRIYDQKL